jgi:arsenite oxidase small subunit
MTATRDTRAAPDTGASGRACMSRRQMLIMGGAAVTVLATFGEGALAQQLVTSSYARKVVGRVSALRPGEAVAFSYPADDIENVLVMLNEEAGGGVGPGRSIVAFNTICPHLGGYMGPDAFKARHSVLGPCPLHLSTFDLTKHGMVVSGHSSSSGDDIVATGVMGLFYGYARNPSGA